MPRRWGGSENEEQDEKRKVENYGTRGRCLNLEIRLPREEKRGVLGTEVVATTLRRVMDR